jgi:lipopolysaccharide/colanic/teichoic acid biosynthesis glycosyltransferase
MEERNFAPILAKLPPPSRRKIEPEQEFLPRIVQECRRAERSGQRFLLVLIEGLEARLENVPAMATSLAAFIRETDTFGWYEDLCTLGILFAELGGATPESARGPVVEKIKAALLQAGCAKELSVSTHILPQDLKEQVRSEDGRSEDGPDRIYKYLETFSSPSIKLQLGIKRVIDLVGSVSLLIALSPLMAIIALAVKCGSRGPVLFRQTRVGQRGRHFTFLKFRSMAVANDSSLHENYVKQFIHGTAAKNTNEKGEGVFKLTEDPRVTALGRFLRKTSMDELPQLWNVLCGEMSLVGPRPPIPYEVECYDLWHQRRVLELKPGITGLWQVCGRSRTGFNEMVRLDLLYARTWSLGLDLKILLRTPRAVFGAGGAH